MKPSPELQHRVRRALIPLGNILQHALVQVEVSGQENIPTQGPTLFAGNHASTFDPLILSANLPPTVYSVGPADFKLTFPGNLVVEYLGVIRVYRGSADKESLKQMAALLKAGEQIALFADGGTWEKRLESVKPGTAYLSQLTGATIVPVAIGGTYQVWDKILRLQRPRVTVHFLPPIGPVEIKDRKTRQQELRRISVEMMEQIYQHLPPEDRARYDLAARQRFSATVQVTPDVLHFADAPAFPVLAELISKPNLFGPLHQNLKLPIQPFVQTDRFFPAQTFEKAIHALQVDMREGVPEYLAYRMGTKKDQAIGTELNVLLNMVQDVASAEAYLRFTPHVEVLDQPLPFDE